MTTTTGSAPVLTATGVYKQFVGVEVLHGVCLELHPGSVHGLVGENGAGKSTLMKILAGVYRADGGEVRLDGRRVAFGHPVEATGAGVATVFQEFNLLPDRTVAQNIFLGREPRRFGLVDTAAMRRDTAAMLAELGIDQISPDAKIAGLTVAEQQLVEITKALSFGARVISMDEPTAALADKEVDLLYGVIRRLKERGTAILYVSHRLKEIFDLCDVITVMKDGAVVSTGPAARLDPQTIVGEMVGRPISTFFPQAEPGTEPGDTLLTVRGGGNEQLDGIDLDIRAGEIVGIAGLQGSGRSELLEAIFGAAPFTRGQVTVAGAPVKITRPRDAVRHGIALVTEDRKRTGLALGQSILDNALLVIRSVWPRRTAAARAEAPSVAKSLEVISQGMDQQVRALSGGNQQKVVLAKWLATAPRVVLLDEPTRGIDVGAKVAVYQLMRRLARDGVAVVLVSSELPELCGMSDRIVILRDGVVVGHAGPSATETEILARAAGAAAARAAAR